MTTRARNTADIVEDAVATYATQSALTSGLGSKLPYSFGTATPTTTDSGFLWYDSNSTPAAPKFWDGAAFQELGGGLTLVASETFTTVSSLSINDCFTSDYDNYKILFRTTGVSTNLNISARLRASGSDSTGSVYDVLQVNTGEASGPTRGVDFGRTSFFWTFTNTFAARIVTAEIFSPALATTTMMFSDFFTISATVGSTSQNGQFHQTTSAFDGISFIASAGTMSGTVRIYGHRN